MSGPSGRCGTKCALLAAGEEREAIPAGLDRLRQSLAEAGQAEHEDIVLDVMDCLVGWCSPHMEL